MAQLIPNGLLIAIEGVDGAGKSTQAQLLCERLNADGYSCLLLREPTDGPFGRQIRELAATGRFEPEQEMQLFIQDREQNVRENIRPALEAGRVVLLDRYYFSSMAYQGARGIDPQRIRAENEKIAPPPNLLIYLAIPLSLVEQRIEDGRGEALNQFEQLEYLGRVKSIFDMLRDESLVRIDGTRAAAQIHAEIHQLVTEWIAARLPA